MENELYYNFKRSLEQKYNAVCFDIDGALTEKKSKSIDKRAITMIIELLKKKVPILFITERDENEFKNLKKEVFSEFEKCSDITDSDVKRIYLLVNNGNGIKLYFSKSMSYSDFLSHSVYLNTNEELEKLKNEKNPVIQISTIAKDVAMKKMEKIIGIPQHSILRIAGSGDVFLKDYLMLNCKQGNSVDKISGMSDKCFPIFDDNKNILKGVDATLELIKKANILPAVCLEKVDKLNYRFNFALAEKNIVSGRKKLLNKYNDLININFCENDGMDSLFDKESGSIIIPMYEWELIVSNPLKDFWTARDNGNFKYVIRDNNNYLLRGSSTYYYFISNRISKNGKDFTSKNDVLNWYNNYIQFLDDAFDAVFGTSDINSIINKKLLLGILDNCRNILLIILNHRLVSDYKKSSVLLDITSKNNRNINNIYNALFDIDETMKNMCFKNNYFVDKYIICELINKSQIILMNEFLNEKKFEDNEDYSKEYRTYREIDNFAENYIAVSLYIEKSNRKNSINVCGLSYGGIELPILAKIIERDKIESALLLKFSKETSGYSNKQLIDLKEFNINNYGGLLNSNLFQNSKVDIFDDNVLTGKTLQLAINSLYDCNINVNNICIVRYPGINRIEQMFLNGTSAINFNLFFNYIYGLCFSSPYSWKDNEWKDNDGKINYTDSLGTFDLNRKKIIECLIKNHDYKEESEVGQYKRRILK